MKNKFFLITFLFIIVVTFTTVIVTGIFFSKEREWLIDQQIEAIAAGLLASELKDAKLSEVDDIVADLLFDQPRTILLNIYDDNKNLLYQNLNSQNILGDDLPPLGKNFFTFDSDDHKIRFLNLKLSIHKNLQIGLLLDQQRSKLLDMNKGILLFLLPITLFAILMAWFYSYTWVRPLIELTEYIQELTVGLEKNLPERPPIPQSLKVLIEGKKKKRSNEIEVLWNSLTYLKNAVETKMNLTKGAMAQMAHELKTPLTIIRNTFEFFLSLKRNKNSLEIDEKIIIEAIEETDRLTVTIGRFLEWSRYESLGGDKNIHAIKLNPFIKEIAHSINRAFPNRSYTFHELEEITVFANREDLRELVSNIIENAFKYSSDNSITITTQNSGLIVLNLTLPIPEKVFQRLGEPFNAGKVSGTNSIGLGIAWVFSICKQYGWNFHFTSENNIAKAFVEFNT